MILRLVDLGPKKINPKSAVKVSSQNGVLVLADQDVDSDEDVDEVKEYDANKTKVVFSLSDHCDHHLTSTVVLQKKEKPPIDFYHLDHKDVDSDEDEEHVKATTGYVPPPKELPSAIKQETKSKKEGVKRNSGEIVTDFN
jgi:hypothetical protein